MVNPGAFQGARKTFLMGKKEAYSQAVDNGYVAEAVAKIQRRYFKRFPIDLSDKVEPTPEELAAIDDDIINPKYEEPDEEKMTTEEYKLAMEKLDVRRTRVAFHKGVSQAWRSWRLLVTHMIYFIQQIKQWLDYQYMKNHNINSKDSGIHNPYRALLFKLTGKEPLCPQMKMACNVWRKTMQDMIEKKVKAMAASQSIAKSGLAALRDKIMRDMFSKLSEEEQRKWQFAAQQEANAAQTMWKEEIVLPPSTVAEDRQR